MGKSKKRSDEDRSVKKSLSRTNCKYDGKDGRKRKTKQDKTYTKALTALPAGMWQRQGMAAVGMGILGKWPLWHKVGGKSNECVIGPVWQPSRTGMPAHMPVWYYQKPVSSSSQSISSHSVRSAIRSAPTSASKHVMSGDEDTPPKEKHVETITPKEPGTAAFPRVKILSADDVTQPTVSADIADQLPSRQLEDLLMEKSYNRKSIKQRVMMHHTGRLPDSDRLANKIASVICEDMTDEVDADKAVLEILRDMTGTTISMKKKIRSKVHATTMQTKRPAELPSWYKTKKFELQMRWQQTRYGFSDIVKFVTLWQSPVKTIEGQFGTGVASYFRFLRRLLFINIPILILSVCFLVVPTVLDKENSYPKARDFNGEEIVLGNGSFTNSVLYYGYYTNKVIMVKESPLSYDMMKAYLFTSGSYYLLSLILLVTSMAKSYRAVYVRGHYDVGVRLMERIFCGWQNGIMSPHAAQLHHRSVFNELKEYLAVLMKTEEQKQFSERVKMGLWRFSSNMFILILIAISSYLVFYMTTFPLHTLNSVIGMPFVVCILFNALPYAFTYIGSKENYDKPETEVFMGMLRTMVLKATVLVVLVYYWLDILPCTHAHQINSNKTSPFQLNDSSIHTIISPNITLPPHISDNTNTTNTSTRAVSGSDQSDPDHIDSDCAMCWETAMAQQIYRLVILDFIFICLSTFFLEFCSTHIQKCYTKKTAVIHFNIGRNTLDIIFSQSLIWLGAFFAPLISLVMIIKLFILFYIKRISASKNLQASDKPWVASRAQTVFLGFLAFFYAINLISIAIAIIFRTPSQHCGPFRGKETIYSVVKDIIGLWGTNYPWLHDTVMFISSAGFVAAIIVFLCIGNYFAWVIKNGHKEMVVSLKGRLTMEGRDKAYLMKRYREINYDVKIRKIATIAVAEDVIS